MLFVRYIAKYLILTVVLQLLLFLNYILYLLAVYRNTVDFYLLILHSSTLLHFYINSNWEAQRRK